MRCGISSLRLWWARRSVPAAAVASCAGCSRSWVSAPAPPVSTRLPCPPCTLPHPAFSPPGSSSKIRSRSRYAATADPANALIPVQSVTEDYTKCPFASAHFAPADLPTFLGGGCRCAEKGGCVLCVPNDRQAPALAEGADGAPGGHALLPLPHALLPPRPSAPLSRPAPASRPSPYPRRLLQGCAACGCTRGGTTTRPTRAPSRAPASTGRRAPAGRGDVITALPLRLGCMVCVAVLC